MMFTDPTGEFIPVPILVGLAIGLLLDFAVEKAIEYCECGEASQGYLPDNKYTAVGGAYGGTGPFATKKERAWVEAALPVTVQA